MTTYVCRTRKDHIVLGVVIADSDKSLFDKIDEDTEPTLIEYSKVGESLHWFEDKHVWLTFKDDDSYTLEPAVCLMKEFTLSLQRQLADPMFDDYTCFVMARQDLAKGHLAEAVERILVDIDKLILLDKDLYDYVRYILEATR